MQDSSWSSLTTVADGTRWDFEKSKLEVIKPSDTSVGNQKKLHSQEFTIVQWMLVYKSIPTTTSSIIWRYLTIMGYQKAVGRFAQFGLQWIEWTDPKRQYQMRAKGVESTKLILGWGNQTVNYILNCLPTKGHTPWVLDTCFWFQGLEAEFSAVTEILSEENLITMDTRGISLGYAI